MTGIVFDIQRFSIHDGPGIRTTVFLKGCPLACLWCHNPEGISAEPILSFTPDKCIGCGYCFEVCPHHAHRMVEADHVLDRDRCVVCGRCARQCYAQALEVIGREMSVAEVIEEVRKDEPFYETSRGGMTLSGGEPLHQINFSLALLRAAKEAGLHCCIETSGLATFEVIQRTMGLVDLYLYDLKETDPGRHVAFTGVSNERILANLRALHDAGEGVRLRLPIIPGCNDRDDAFREIAALVAELPDLEGVEIMPYHNLGTSKNRRLGLTAPAGPEPTTPDADQVDAWICRFEELGVTLLNEKKRA